MSPVAPPRPKPSDVGSPVPQSAPAAPSPEEQALMDEALKQLNVAQSPGQEGAEAVPAAPAAEGPSPAEQQLMDEALAQLGESPEAAQPTGLGESLATAAKSYALPAAAGFPVYGLAVAAKDLYDSFVAGGKGEVPLKARIASKLAHEPERQIQILQKIMGPSVEFAIDGDNVVRRAVGTQEWKPVDKNTTDTLYEAVADILDWVPEFGETAVQSGLMAAGSVAAPITGGTSVPVAMGANAVVGAASTAAREYAARLAGAEPDPNFAQNLGMSAGISALFGGAAQYLFRNKADQAAEALIKKVTEKAPVGRATKLSHIQNEADDLFKSITGASHPALREGAETVGEIGMQSQQHVLAKEAALGEAVGTAWDASIDAVKHVPISDVPVLMEGLEKELGRYYTLKAKAPTSVGGPVTTVWEKSKEIPDYLRGHLIDMKQMWESLYNGKGTSPQGYREILEQIKDNANWGNKTSPSRGEGIWRDLIPKVAKERNAFFTKYLKNDGMGEFAVKAFDEYNQKIDAVRKLADAAEKDPAKFVRSIFGDMKSATVMRDTLLLSEEGKPIWDKLRLSWLEETIDAVKDKKTGIVNLTELARKLTPKKDMLDTVFGYGTHKEFERLGTAMDKITWEGILRNPDSISNNALIRAISRVIGTRFNPAYTANAIGAIADYNPEILTLLQNKGILKFAQEAKTMVEKHHWMQTAKAIQRLQKSLTLGKDGRWSVRMERSLIGPALNAGYRATNENETDLARKRQKLDALINEQQNRSAAGQ